MTYQELMNLVGNSDPIDDWERLEVPGHPFVVENDEGKVTSLTKTAYVYKPNIAITIEREDSWHEKQVGLGNPAYEWATRHPNNEAYNRIWAIKYYGNTIFAFPCVAIDGFRAEICWPRDGKVSKFDDKLGRILTRNEREYNSYFQQSGLVLGE